jgi:glycosyltransferase involved in cell wall biosynthesis
MPPRPDRIEKGPSRRLKAKEEAQSEQVLVYGISMVRNEVDIIDLNIRYHLALGVDNMIIVDNGSTDGTDKLLQQISSRDSRVNWSKNDGPFLPTAVMTELAHEAFKAGADWIVPIDADEFWYAPMGDFREVLRNSDVGTLAAKAVNFIQRRAQRESSPTAPLYMTRRSASPVEPPGHGQTLVEAHEIAFVEKMYPPKCVFRPTAQVEIETGHHKIYNANGPREDTNDLVCLHAPIRSREALQERITSASRAAEAGRKKGQGRNRRRLAELQGELAIEQEWAANSYRGGYLDVYGKRHPVIFDPRLRDAVAPFLPQPFWRRLYWRLQGTSKSKGT